MKAEEALVCGSREEAGRGWFMLVFTSLSLKA